MRFYSTILLFFIHYLVFAQVTVEEYYDTEKTKLKTTFQISDTITNTLNGEYKEYFASGKIKIQGQYHAGIADGRWKYFYENGNPRMEGEVEQGVSNGMWTYYFESGQVSMKGTLKGSQKEGDWEFYYESGDLKSRGRYRSGIKAGIWNYYYEDGNLKAQAYYKGNRGQYREYYTDGTLKMEGINIEGKSDSLWKKYYETGELEAVGMYRSGVKNGPWTFYYRSGTISSEGEFKNGLSHGKWTYYHPNGEIQAQGAEYMGKKEGYWKLFDPSGKFMGEGVYFSGNGTYTEFYDNGRAKVTGFIRDGAYDSTWYYYYEDGILEGQTWFDMGNGEYTGYYPSGNIQMKGLLEGNKRVGVWELYEPDGTLAGYYRPVYEEETPVFRVIKYAELNESYSSKPEYIDSKRKFHYFQPVVNEYRGIIAGSNPFMTAFGHLPFSMEYYFQERLGYEAFFNLERSPFYESGSSISPGRTYFRGASIGFRQKFYHKAGDIGLFYFGHEIRYTYRNLLQNIDQGTINATNFRQSSVEMSVVVGDRLLRDVIEPGLTIDVFASLGVRYMLNNGDASPEASVIFADQLSRDWQFVPRIGLNIGYNFKFTKKPVQKQ